MMNGALSSLWDHTVWRWHDWQASWPVPGYLLAILLALAVALSFAVYLWRSRRPRGQALVLGTLRAFAFLLLLLMIGGVSRLRFEEDRSELVLLIDNSLSMAAPEENLPLDEFLQASAGTLPVQTRWETLQQVLLQDPDRLTRLAQRYRLHPFFLDVPDRNDRAATAPAEEAANGSPPSDVGEEALAEQIRSLRPIGETSPIGDSLEQAVALQRGRATAAIVLMSDGIVNRGGTLQQAARLAEQQEIPLVTVGFGSDAPPVDVAVDEVLADTSALLGDTVEVRAIVRSAGTEGESVEVQLVDEETGEVYDSERLPGTKEERFDALRFSYLAEEEKRYQLAVVAKPIEGERESENNRRSLAIDIRDEPLRVLLVQDKPSYEFRFLKHLLERTTSLPGATPPPGDAPAKRLVELTSVLQSGDPEYADQDRSAVRLPPVGVDRLAAFDVVILSDAAVRLLGSVFLEQLATVVRDQGVGLIIVAGPQHLPAELAGTELAPLLPVRPDGVTAPRFPVTQPTRMQLTELGKQTPALELSESGESELPAIYGHWRAETLRPAARVLIETVPQGNAAAERHPLLVSQLVGAGQVWVQLTDQSYRMEPYDGTGTLYRRYWLQMIRRLARGKRQTRQSAASVDVIGDRFPAGVDVPVQVRASGAGGEVTISVRGGASEREIVLSEAGDGIYRGEIPALPAGAYRAVLIDPATSETPPADRFQVESVPHEWTRLRSELDDLRQIAEQTGGLFLEGDEAVERLESVLPEAEMVRRRPLPPQPLWKHPLTVAILIGLLCSEWLLRRRWGYS